MQHTGLIYCPHWEGVICKKTVTVKTLHSAGCVITAERVFNRLAVIMHVKKGLRNRWEF
jgi:hypothetical protein